MGVYVRGTKPKKDRRSNVSSREASGEEKVVQGSSFDVAILSDADACQLDHNVLEIGMANIPLATTGERGKRARRFARARRLHPKPTKGRRQVESGTALSGWSVVPHRSVWVARNLSGGGELIEKTCQRPQKRWNHTSRPTGLNGSDVGLIS